MHSRGAQARRSNAVLGRSERNKPRERGWGALAQRNRRGMSKYAPLQNRFRECSGKRWPSIELLRRSMQLRFISEKYLGDNPALDWKKILARNLNNLRLASKRRAKHLAARHLVIAALLRWRRLTAMTMHSRCQLRLGHDHCTYCAMIGYREPRRDSR
jgi:hypothetical protein